jgi:hypothetical protein
VSELSRQNFDHLLLVGRAGKGRGSTESEDGECNGGLGVDHGEYLVLEGGTKVGLRGVQRVTCTKLVW